MLSKVCLRHVIQALVFILGKLEKSETCFLEIQEYDMLLP